MYYGKYNYLHIIGSVHINTCIKNINLVERLKIAGSPAARAISTTCCGGVMPDASSVCHTVSFCNLIPITVLSLRHPYLEARRYGAWSGGLYCRVARRRIITPFSRRAARVGSPTRATLATSPLLGRRPPLAVIAAAERKTRGEVGGACLADWMMIIYV